jgi:hypothetical protein
MSKQHLDGLAIAARSLESFGFRQGASNIASVLVDIAQNPARGHLWTAFWFEHASTAVRQRCLVPDRVIRADVASGREHLAVGHR